MLVYVECYVQSMGNRASAPVFPTLDPMFISLGCTGLYRHEYDYPRLDLAPFLYYRIKVSTYTELIARILEIMRTLPPMDGEPPPPPATPEDLQTALKRIHGPVYMFVAFDPEKGTIEAYLYFPSMTKEGKKWHSLHFIGLAHSWMYRLIFSPDYNILLPHTNCALRVSDPKDSKSMGMMLGCRTEMSYSCVQSKRAHKMMRIYHRRKPITYYPAAYFRVYQLDLADPRLAKYVEDDSMKELRRDILSSDLDMFSGCRYMLISENRKYFMVLSNSWLTIFYSYGNESLEGLCRFNLIPATSIPVRMIRFQGQMNSRMVIENGELTIYSDIWDDETIVFAKKVVLEGSRGPYALVLQNDGSLVIIDANNKVASSKDGIMGSARLGRRGAEDLGEYDPIEDYRRRIINLIAYLRMYNLYKEIQTDKNLPKDVAMYVLQDGIPPYNAQEDYKERLSNLVKYLISKGYTNVVQQAVKKSMSKDLNMQFDTPNFEAPKLNTDGNNEQLEEVQPASGGWEEPDGTVDPNPDGDNPNCPGLEGEQLADCVDAAEAITVAEEVAEEQAAQDSEYKFMDSKDPMETGRVNDESSDMDPASAESSSSRGVRTFTEDEYQRSIAVCRVSSMNQSYIGDQDLFCRVIALKDYFRKRGYKVVQPTAIKNTAVTAAPINGAVADYSPPIDFAGRLQAARASFPKSQ